MARKLKGQQQTLSGSPSGQFTNFSPKPIVALRAPTTADTGYEIGQIWVDTTSGLIYGLADVSGGSAQWNIFTSGASDIDTLTGDSGGALSPTGGNMNIVGGDGLTVAGSGSTLTINRDAEGGYPITPYVVGPIGQAGYQTIQSAIDAANANGGGYIFVQSGTYNENLTFYDKIVINGTIVLSAFEDSAGVFINGVHTPPNAGGISFNYVDLLSATDIFQSAAAGTCQINISNAAIVTTDGYTFNLPNWTGILGQWNTNATGSLTDNNGAYNNTGGAFIACYENGLGWGTGKTMITSGSMVLEACDIRPPWNITGGAVVDTYNMNLTGEVTISGTASGWIKLSHMTVSGTPAVTYSGTGAFEISNCVIQSDNNPAIDGAGAGTLTVASCTFTDDFNLAGTLTLAYGGFLAGVLKQHGNATFDSGTFTIASDTDPINISADAFGTTVNIATGAGAKTLTIGSTNTTSTTTVNSGSGGIQLVGNVDLTTGSLQIEGAAQRLAVEGGAVTDFIGQGTLVLGTLTIANTNIAANDRVFVQRSALNGSAGLGDYLVTISAGASFTVDSVNSVGVVVTDDISTFDYFIVRQL